MTIDWSTVKDFTIPEGEVKQIAINGTVVWRKSVLPSGYQQLEYLEATGTQYIDTGIIITPQTIYNIKYTPTVGSWIAGYTKGSGGRWGLAYNSSTTVMTFYSDRTNCATDIPVGYTEATYDFGVGITYNGVTTQFPTTPTRSSDFSGWLFKAQGSSAQSGSQVYWFTIWQNGQKVQELVPCRRLSDSVLGMYDLVTNTMFTNAGTGTFVAGGNV